MLALMITKATEVSIKNHMYRFDGKLYKQEDGGPIGDELSQAVARLVMIWWDEMFLDRCQKLDMNVMMYTRYVDDANLAVVPLDLGVRCEDNKLKVIPELREEDRKDKRDRTTARTLKEIANEIKVSRT